MYEQVIENLRRWLLVGRQGVDIAGVGRTRFETRLGEAQRSMVTVFLMGGLGGSGPMSLELSPTFPLKTRFLTPDPGRMPLSHRRCVTEISR